MVESIGTFFNSFKSTNYIFLTVRGRWGGVVVDGVWKSKYHWDCKQHLGFEAQKKLFSIPQNRFRTKSFERVTTTATYLNTWIRNRKLYVIIWCLPWSCCVYSLMWYTGSYLQTLFHNKQGTCINGNFKEN